MIRFTDTKGDPARRKSTRTILKCSSRQLQSTRHRAAAETQQKNR